MKMNQKLIWINSSKQNSNKINKNNKNNNNIKYNKFYKVNY